MRLLEREDALRALEDAFESARRAGGVMVLVGGEAGVGKSALIRTFADRLGTAARIALGFCEPHATPAPLGPIHEVALALGADGRPVLRAEGRPAAATELLGVLARPRQPIVAVVEDAHWSDGATLDLLRTVGRRVARTRSLVIVSYRDDEVVPGHPLRVLLGDLATVANVRRLPLRSLGRASVGELARGTELDADRLFERTGGNPFFVTEVVAAAAAQDDQGREPPAERGPARPPGVGPHDPPPATDVPPTVRDAVLARVARLPRAAQRVLQAAAVLGQAVDAATVLEVSGSSPRSLDACIGAGVLLPSGSVVAFRHELARLAVEAEIPAGTAQALHARALAALERRSEPAMGRLAHHAEAAGDAAAVVRYAPAAGERAMELHAHREAVAQFARARRAAGAATAETRLDLLERYAVACQFASAVEEAIEARHELVAAWRSRGDLDRVRWSLVQLIMVLVHDGRHPEADAVASELLALVRDVAPGVEAGRALAMQCYVRMLERDGVEAVAWGERAVAMLEPTGDTRSLKTAYAFLALALLMAGRTEEAFAARTRSLEYADRLGIGEAERASTSSSFGSGLAELMLLGPARTMLTEGLTLAAELDLDVSHDYAQAWLALVELAEGAWDAAADRARAVVRRPHASVMSRIMALVALGRVRARRGDPQVWDALDEALRLAEPSRTLQRLGPVRTARAEAASLEGDAAAAGREATAVYALALGKRHPWYAGELAFWRRRAGIAEPAPGCAALPWRLHLEDRTAEAAAAWDEIGCPYESARARADAPDAADRRAALEAFTRLGARPAAAALARELRREGVADLPRGPTARTLANPAALTARELEVLRCVARGLPNGQIASLLHISPRTAGHHVSAILGKLEVRNRTEAAAEARRRGIVD